MATHSSTLAWKIPWTEDPGKLQPMGSQLSDFSRSEAPSTPISSASSPFRNFQSYIQAIRDLGHLIFFPNWGMLSTRTASSTGWSLKNAGTLGLPPHPSTQDSLLLVSSSFIRFMWKGLVLILQAEPRLLLPLQELAHTCLLQGRGTQRLGCQVLNRELQESPRWWWLSETPSQQHSGRAPMGCVTAGIPIWSRLCWSSKSWYAHPVPPSPTSIWHPDWVWWGRWGYGECCIWAPRVLSSGWEPLFWDRHSDQGEEGSPAEGGRAGEGEGQEALGLPGHPPLCQSDCGQERPEPLVRSTQEGQTLHSTDGEWEQLVWQGPPCRGGHVHVQGSWHHSQWHLLDPLYSGLPPQASAEVPGKDPEPPGRCCLHHLVSVQEIEEPCPIWVRENPWLSSPACPQMGFLLGTIWTRCPTPPCASKRHWDSIHQYQPLAESSTSPLPSVMDAPYLQLWISPPHSAKHSVGPCRSPHVHSLFQEILALVCLKIIFTV